MRDAAAFPLLSVGSLTQGGCQLPCREDTQAARAEAHTAGNGGFQLTALIALRTCGRALLEGDPPAPAGAFDEVTVAPGNVWTAHHGRP